MDSREILQRGLERQALPLDDCTSARLLQFIALLEKWNAVYNLTAVRDKSSMVSRHLLDSLTLAPFLASFSNIADLGSGGGLPGIPLAIVFPEKKFNLIDSNVKKTRFLVHVATTLGLKNIDITHQRIENFQPEKKFDCLVSRAFASPQIILRTSAHLCAKSATLLLMVGHADDLDLSPHNDFEWRSTNAVDVYNESSTRHIVVFSRHGSP